MSKAQIAFDIVFAIVVIAFIHFLAILFAPGPMVAEMKQFLDWFTN